MSRIPASVLGNAASRKLRVPPFATSLGLTASQTNAGWILTGRLVIASAGSTDTALAVGGYSFYNQAGPLVANRGMVNGGGTAGTVPTVSFSTGSAQTLSVTETASPLASGQYFNLSELVVLVFK